jgi:hypothetical protein
MGKVSTEALSLRQHTVQPADTGHGGEGSQGAEPSGVISWKEDEHFDFLRATATIPQILRQEEVEKYITEQATAMIGRLSTPIYWLPQKWAALQMEKLAAVSEGTKGALHILDAYSTQDPRTVTIQVQSNGLMLKMSFQSGKEEIQGGWESQ